VEWGDCSLSSVLDSLVPPLQELPEPKPLTTFKGKEIVSTIISELPSFSSLGSRDDQPTSGAKGFV
jgi:hypothetical protein